MRQDLRRAEEAVRRLALTSWVRFVGYAPLADLPALYQMAQVAVFPSLDEGFGLPVLEAFAAGAPLAASNAGAIPEVAGEAALLNDARDDEGLAARGVLEPGEDLDQPERDVGLARVALRAEEMADAADRLSVVGGVAATIADRRPLVGVGIDERQGPVAGDEEAGREEERGQHYRMKARTSPARASTMRMRAIGMSPGGSRSGGNHSQASDSGPQASAPPVIRHSNDELT